MIIMFEGSVLLYLAEAEKINTKYCSRTLKLVLRSHRPILPFRYLVIFLLKVLVKLTRMFYPLSACCTAISSEMKHYFLLRERKLPRLRMFRNLTRLICPLYWLLSCVNLIQAGVITKKPPLRICLHEIQL